MLDYPASRTSYNIMRGFPGKYRGKLGKCRKKISEFPFSSSLSSEVAPTQVGNFRETSYIGVWDKREVGFLYHQALVNVLIEHHPNKIYIYIFI